MAPVPKKELMAKSRDMKRQGPEKWDEYLRKNRQKNIIARCKKRLTMCEEEKHAHREKEKLRKRAQRLKKNISTPKIKASIITKKRDAYSCPQTFGKAIKKATSKLPTCPTKKQAVVKELFLRVFESEDHNGYRIMVEKSKSKFRAESNQRILVADFYFSDDITRQAPRKRDLKTVRDERTRVKQRIPIRHLLMTVTEAHFEFKKIHPKVNVSLSAFYSWRPKYILLSKQMPHNVCVCKVHLNFSFLIDSVHSCVKDFPGNSKSLLAIICCDQKNENCMFNHCKNCTYDVRKIFLKIWILELVSI
ncbi:uncharacterized protein LOC117175211 [Belonocnema kinseyi]|uniref:uncharacterized protein LOC117175211 n=1 Tax=Belonocnema kinseyi TaxID=2817044 RepID=UPI00143D8CC1|nr:uncharacterized protein LOC117175211 [Belonocnema kinseyi]